MQHRLLADDQGKSISFSSGMSQMLLQIRWLFFWVVYAVARFETSLTHLYVTFTVIIYENMASYSSVSSLIWITKPQIKNQIPKDKRIKTKSAWFPKCDRNTNAHAAVQSIHLWAASPGLSGLIRRYSYTSREGWSICKYDLLPLIFCKSLSLCSSPLLLCTQARATPLRMGGPIQVGCHFKPPFPAIAVPRYLSHGNQRQEWRRDGP